MLYYSVSLKDPIIELSVDNSSVTFDYRGVFTKNIKSSDGDVVIPLTGLGTLKALYISTDKQISAEINGNPGIEIAKTLFIELNGLSSLTISCTDVSGAEVNIILWGG